MKSKLLLLPGGGYSMLLLYVVAMTIAGASMWADAKFDYGGSKVWHLDYMRPYEMTQLRLQVKKYPVVKRCHAYWLALDKVARESKQLGTGSPVSSPSVAEVTESIDDEQLLQDVALGRVPSDWGLLFRDIVEALPEDWPYEQFVRKDLIDCLDIWSSFFEPSQSKLEPAVWSPEGVPVGGGLKASLSTSSGANGANGANGESGTQTEGGVAGAETDQTEWKRHGGGDQHHERQLLESPKVEEEPHLEELDVVEKFGETDRVEGLPGQDYLYWIKSKSDKPEDAEACRAGVAKLVAQSHTRPVVVVLSHMYTSGLMEALNRRLRSKQLVRLVLTDYADQMDTNDIVGVYFGDQQYKIQLKRYIPYRMGLMYLDAERIVEDVANLLKTLSGLSDDYRELL